MYCDKVIPEGRIVEKPCGLGNKGVVLGLSLLVCLVHREGSFKRAVCFERGWRKEEEVGAGGLDRSGGVR